MSAPKKIKIVLISGHNIMPERNRAVCDPFVILRVGAYKHCSSTKVGINPIWNESFIFNMGKYEPVLRLELRDKDRLKLNASFDIGQNSVDLQPYFSQLPALIDVRMKYGSITIQIENGSGQNPLGSQTVDFAAITQQVWDSSAPAPDYTITSAIQPSLPWIQSLQNSGQIAGSTSGSSQNTHYTSTLPDIKPPQASISTSTSIKPPQPQATIQVPVPSTYLQQPQSQVTFPIPLPSGSGINTQQPIEVFQGPSVYDPSVDADDWVPPTNLPAQFDEKPEEIKEQIKRWAKFATFMRKPYNYTSKYKLALQELDALGCINLQRVKREQIPTLTINYAIAIFFNPYEGQSESLGVGPVNDALLIAKLFQKRGYRIFYFCDASAQEYYRWMDWLLENVELELVSYFSGQGVQVPDSSGREADGLSELMKFVKKSDKGTEGIPLETRERKFDKTQKIAEDTISDAAMHNLILGKEYPQTRVVLISDCSHSGTMFNLDQEMRKVPPPPNVIHIGSCLDSQTAKQFSFEGMLAGIFTYHFCDFLSKKNPQGTFAETEKYLDGLIKDDQKVQVTSSTAKLFNDTVLLNLRPEQQEIQVAQIDSTLLNGTPPSSITSIPPEDQYSQVEDQAAQQRWGLFTAELSKPAPYNSKFRNELQKLDSQGCINLERIKREQIPPNITIYRCAALFFNPYEDLPHTLGLGPVNDGLLMADLFLSRGYNVVYLCDATPHEYYKWMDWLLENVEDELVSFFSGHGTQVPDKTGKEKDGLSEVLVFYNAKKKKSTQSVVKVVAGITDETVEDTVMHDLILSKSYPQTRVVLITDCCHSGTMFNFDYELGNDGVGGGGGKKRPPLNVVCIGSALDNQTAKQTVMNKTEAGVFTYNFCTLIKQNPNASFLELQNYMKKNIQKYQTIQLTGNDTKNFTQPIIANAK